MPIPVYSFIESSSRTDDEAEADELIIHYRNRVHQHANRRANQNDANANYMYMYNNSRKVQDETQVLSDTIRAMTKMERSRYITPSASPEFFLSNEIYKEYIERGRRAQAIQFFAQFARERSCFCGQDFVLLAILSLDRFIAAYFNCEGDAQDAGANIELAFPEQEWNLILVTILQLTVKMKSNIPGRSSHVSLGSYASYFADILAGSSSTTEDLCKMEVKILKALDYNVTPPLARCFIGLLSATYATMGASTADNHHHHHRQCSRNSVMEYVAIHAVHIMEEHCTDVQLMGKPQSLVAFACMRYVMQMDARLSDVDIQAFERLVDDTVGCVCGLD